MHRHDEDEDHLFLPGPPPPRKTRLRPEWVYLPLCVLLLFWLNRAGVLDMTWDCVLYRLWIVHCEAFSRLVALALVLAGGLAALRVLRAR